MQSEAAAENNTDLFYASLAGGPLKFAEMYSTEYAQIFLNDLIVSYNKVQSYKITNAIILGGKSQNDIYAKWETSDIQGIDKACLKEESREYKHEKAFYPFTINVTFDTCSKNEHVETIFKWALYPPIILSVVLVIAFGIFLSFMLTSVQRAGQIIGSELSHDDLQAALSRISWRNIRELTENAAVPKNRTIQQLQSLIKDTHHDISKILQKLQNKIPENTDLRSLSLLISKLSLEVDRGGQNQEEHRSQAIDLSKFHEFLERKTGAHFEKQGLPTQEADVVIKDAIKFERILINLLSNASQHGIGKPQNSILFLQQSILIRVTSTISLLDYGKIFLARMLGRLNTNDPNKPVYEKVYGREGRGLNIIKRFSLDLGGSFYFTLGFRKLHVGVSLPFSLKQESTAQNKQANESTQSKVKIALLLENKHLRTEVLEEYQLPKEYFVEKSELNGLLEHKRPLYLITDSDEDFPPWVRCFLVQRKERLKSILNNLLKLEINRDSHST